VLHATLTLGLLAAVSCFGSTSSAIDDPLEKEYTIALHSAEEQVRSIAEVVTRDLHKTDVTVVAPPENGLTEDGRWFVVGDLFKSKGCFALVELPPAGNSNDREATMVCAEYVEGGWHVRGLWRLPIVWRPEGWKESADDYLPVKPSTHPFKLKDLSGDGVPEVIVAGEVEKYFQGYYLLRFDPKSRGLKLLAYSMAEPEVAGEFVRLYHHSGRLAIWSRSEYYRWVGDSLALTASWHSEVSYTSPDISFTDVTVRGGDGKETVFRVTDEGSWNRKESVVKVLRDDKPYATVTMNWRADQINDQSQEAWLFERLTGLTRDLYPAGSDRAASDKFETPIKVVVKGTAEAKQRFALKKAAR
jgi:hypothetical protein